MQIKPVLEFTQVMPVVDRFYTYNLKYVVPEFSNQVVMTGLETCVRKKLMAQRQHEMKFLGNEASKDEDKNQSAGDEGHYPPGRPPSRFGDRQRQRCSMGAIVAAHSLFRKRSWTEESA